MKPLLRAEIDKIMNDFIDLTKEKSIAVSAHKVLEQVVDIQCMYAKITDYGLPMIDESLIRVANTPETRFLLQGELKAIKEGLKYTEIEIKGFMNSTYKGYVDQDGKYEGVGILFYEPGWEQQGEWHKGNLNGCVKLTAKCYGSFYWGGYKSEENGFGAPDGFGTTVQYPG